MRQVKYLHLCIIVLSAVTCTLAKCSRPYSDGFTRNVIFPLIGATKGSGFQQLLCASRGVHDIKFEARVNVSCNGVNDGQWCVADLYTSRVMNSIYIVPHGSHGFAQQDDIGQEIENPVLVSVNGVKGKVLKYWKTAFQSLWSKGLHGVFDFALGKYPNAVIYTVGHSLGAAISSVLAMHLIHNHNIASSRIRSITFGCPRVGDKEFADNFNKLIPVHWRVVNQQDPISALPAHLGPLTTPSSLLMRHTNFEVYYPTNMTLPATYITCPLTEDPYCRGSIVGDDNDFHSLYFNVNISNWHKNGCEY